jgi:hypothetical protein
VYETPQVWRATGAQRRGLEIEMAKPLRSPSDSCVLSSYRHLWLTRVAPDLSLPGLGDKVRMDIARIISYTLPNCKSTLEATGFSFLSSVKSILKTCWEFYLH